MQLSWYGTAGLILQEEETVIAFDPFLGIPIDGSCDNTALSRMDTFRTAGSIFVTHGHFDHIYHIPRLYHDLDVSIYCTKTPYRTLCKNGITPRQLCRITPGWQKEIGPFQVTAYQSRHCRFDAPLVIHKIFSKKIWRHFPHLLHLIKLILHHPERGEILLYEVSCKGKRIQIMGSMNLDAGTIYPTGADLLILPLQGRSDQDRYALALVDRLKPGRIMLDHYDDAFGPLTDEVETAGFIKNVQEAFGISCKPLKKGETVYE